MRIGRDWQESKRLLLGTHDAYLISIDAKTGALDKSFGEGGRIDLMGSLAHAVRATNYSVTAAPVVCKDVVVVGASIHDGPTHKEWPRGDVSGFDVRTGKKLWTIHSIPQKGEFGNETWGDDSWTYTGSTNVWTNMSSDEELGYVYLPFGTPTDDFYGGHRPGANLFAETIMAIDAKTGKRAWHFQGVHHGIWDYDFPAAPILVDINVNGKPIKALAQVSKQGFTYVLDRRTGAPVWPIEERPVPQSTVPGERTSPTQPFPTKPPAYERQGVTESDLIDFTPELKAAALEVVKQFETGPIFTPPSEKGTIVNPGWAGGANWAGASFDPETGTLYVPSMTSPIVVQLVKPNPERSNLLYARGGTQMPPMLDGLPLLKPPYGRVTAIDLNKGDTKWVAAVGDGPRNHPLLKDLNLPALGAPIRNAAMVTKTLLVRRDGRWQSRRRAQPAGRRASDEQGGDRADQVPRLRQGDRSAAVGHGRPGASARVADDLHASGKAVHRGRGGKWTERRANRVRAWDRRGLAGLRATGLGLGLEKTSCANPDACQPVARRSPCWPASLLACWPGLRAGAAEHQLAVGPLQLAEDGGESRRRAQDRSSMTSTRRSATRAARATWARCAGRSPGA